MKFGTVVMVQRGSVGRAYGTPGCLRYVAGRLLGARGHQRYVRLLQDDPFATVGYCTDAGSTGQWDDSVVALLHDEPAGQRRQVVAIRDGQQFLGDVRGTFQDPCGQDRMVVKHFSGEPWPWCPLVSEVEVLVRDPDVDALDVDADG